MEYFTFVCIEAHAPTVRPGGEFVQTVLQLPVVVRTNSLVSNLRVVRKFKDG